MKENKPITSALISVFNKEGLAPIIHRLDELGVTIYSTGGTADFIESLGVKTILVEDVTGYPSIFSGRVKTLHPKVFGGILYRRDNTHDLEQAKQHDIPPIDLVIVDLYPFQQTVRSGANPEQIIEKIDIGGISLIRAAAKNFNHVLCVSHMQQYPELLNILQKGNTTTLQQRLDFATKAFAVSSGYDREIYAYFNKEAQWDLPNLNTKKQIALRYGENPHQKGVFFGDFDSIFEKISGKDLSYNNLLDVDSAYALISEFANDAPTFAILKHNNACGVATRPTLLQAYRDALISDPISAFGGILIANTTIEKDTAEQIHSLFCEVIIAPSFSEEAIAILSQKKNRILLKMKHIQRQEQSVRSCLNGVLLQQIDYHTDSVNDLQTVTQTLPTQQQIDDMIFASKICKHTKSNAIVLAKNLQLLASGVGQTSRVDALKQAIEKAQHFQFSLKDATMASDAFFPFPDCVKIAHKEGINSVIQPGGSVKDHLSIDYCNENNIAMVFTKIRHFKH